MWMLNGNSMCEVKIGRPVWANDLAWNLIVTLIPCVVQLMESLARFAAIFVRTQINEDAPNPALEESAWRPTDPAARWRLPAATGKAKSTWWRWRRSRRPPTRSPPSWRWRVPITSPPEWPSSPSPVPAGNPPRFDPFTTSSNFPSLLLFIRDWIVWFEV